MILTAVATCRMKEDNLLLSLSRLLVENLTLSPKRRFDVGVATDNAVLVQLILGVFGSRASEGIV